MSIRTLAQPSRAASAIASSSRSFSTTPAVMAGGKGPKKSAIVVQQKKMVKGFIVRSKGQSGPLGPMNRGLKLSYAMASPPPDLSELEVLTPGIMTQSNVGTATTFSRAVYEGINAFGLPRQIETELAKSGAPASSIRQATVDLVNLLKSQEDKSSADARYMLTGDMGTGKSMLLVQTMAYALQSNWIILFAPQTLRWINSTSPYAYNSNTKIFDQPAIASSILDSLARVNGQKLNQIETPDGSTLLEYVRRSAKNELLSVKGLEATLDVLAKQTQFPVLMGLDDVQTLFATSKYRTPQFDLIEAYHLSTPRIFLDYISNRKSFARGMVLSAYSHTTPQLPATPSFLYGLSLPSTRPITPYEKFEPVHLAHASSEIKHFALPYGFTTKEAVGMYEIWTRKGWTPKANDELFMSAYSGACGNPKEFARGLRHNVSSFYQYDHRIGESIAEKQRFLAQAG